MRLKSNKLIVYLTCLWLFLTLLLGGWWLYFIIKIATDLERVAPDFFQSSSTIRMAKWEGTTFFTLLFLLTGTMIYLYLKDIKKNRAVSSFFAAITHELKTPLASMRLQSEVMKETIANSENKNPRLEVLSSRLIEDAQRLENEMDKLLQLSRMERDSRLELESIDLEEFIAKLIKKHALDLDVQLHGDFQQTVMADEYALGLVIRNLIENTKRHTQSSTAKLEISNERESIVLTYQDEGEGFSGDVSKLGNIFYKGRKSKGSGIGLYLAKTLLKSMNGSLEITQSGKLIFKIYLKKGLSH